MGFLGGLVMSAIKRDRGVKDWGAMIEGHGGMLDRLEFGHLRRADFFPPDAVFLRGVMKPTRYSFAAAAGTAFPFGRHAKASPSPRQTT